MIYLSRSHNISFENLAGIELKKAWLELSMAIETV